MAVFRKPSHLLAIFLISLSAGCGKAPEPKQTERVLRMNIHREPPTMDPRKQNDLTGGVMHFIMFDGLMRVAPDGTILPAQAESVEISDDRKTYTFHLRDSFWSDGTAVTAHDFEASWKKILSPDFPAFNAHLLYPIEGAEAAKKGEISLDLVGVHAADAKTLVVKLQNPTPYFLDLCAYCVLFPVHHKIDIANPNWAYEAGPQFVTNGPFRLSSWKHNNEIVFEKNPHFWEASQIYLDKILVTMVSEENTVLNMFENGELDLISHGISPIPTEALRKFQNEGLLHVFPCPGSTFVTFNVNKFPFTNKNIRKAFALAINRQEIVDNITQMGEDVALSFIPSHLKGDYQIPFYKDNDVSLARTLFEQGLKELGLSAGEFPQVIYSYSSSSNNQKLAQAIQFQWEKNLGVRVVLQNCEHKVLIDQLGRRNYDVGQALYIAFYNDPMSILERFKLKANMKNYPGWENAEYIRLLEKSMTDLSPEERQKSLQQAEALFMDEMPLTAIYHWKSPYLMKPYIANPEVLLSAGNNFARIVYHKDVP